MFNDIAADRTEGTMRLISLRCVPCPAFRSAPADPGFTARRLSGTGSADCVRGVVSALSVDVGTVFLVLGVLRRGNVFVLHRLHRRATDGAAV